MACRWRVRLRLLARFRGGLAGGRGERTIGRGRPNGEPGGPPRFNRAVLALLVRQRAPDSAPAADGVCRGSVEQDQWLSRCSVTYR